MAQHIVLVTQNIFMQFFGQVSHMHPLLHIISSFSTILMWTKGQLISKADWRAIESPKKQTDEFVLFAFLLFKANKSNSPVPFLGEYMACQSAFWFYLTFGKNFKGLAV